MPGLDLVKRSYKEGQADAHRGKLLEAERLSATLNRSLA